MRESRFLVRELFAIFLLVSFPLQNNTGTARAAYFTPSSINRYRHGVVCRFRLCTLQPPTSKNKGRMTRSSLTRAVDNVAKQRETGPARLRGGSSLRGSIPPSSFDERSRRTGAKYQRDIDNCRAIYYWILFRVATHTRAHQSGLLNQPTYNTG